jgi:hypothetical protein
MKSFITCTLALGLSLLSVTRAQACDVMIPGNAESISSLWWNVSTISPGETKEFCIDFRDSVVAQFGAQLTEPNLSGKLPSSIKLALSDLTNNTTVVRYSDFYSYFMNPADGSFIVYGLRTSIVSLKVSLSSKAKKSVSYRIQTNGQY